MEKIKDYPAKKIYDSRVGLNFYYREEGDEKTKVYMVNSIKDYEKIRKNLVAELHENPVLHIKNMELLEEINDAKYISDYSANDARYRIYWSSRGAGYVTDEYVILREYYCWDTVPFDKKAYDFMHENKEHYKINQLPANRYAAGRVEEFREKIEKDWVNDPRIQEILNLDFASKSDRDLCLIMALHHILEEKLRYQIPDRANGEDSLSCLEKYYGSCHTGKMITVEAARQLGIKMYRDHMPEKIHEEAVYVDSEGNYWEIGSTPYENRSPFPSDGDIENWLNTFMAKDEDGAYYINTDKGLITDQDHIDAISKQINNYRKIK